MLKTLHSMGMLLFLVFLCLAVGQLGTFFMTDTSMSWYFSLQKPVWTPPNLAFPLVWTLLYVLMALSVWRVWRAKKPGYHTALAFWCIQLFLNALWTPIFFGLQNILYGLIIIDLLWISIMVTMILFFKHSKFAAFLMLLYLLWVTYAGFLNLMIWQMNT